MKKYFCFSIVLVFLISCDTNPTASQIEEVPLAVEIDNLVGSWSWVNCVDSTNQTIDKASDNNNDRIEFTKDYTFKQYHNGSLFLNDKFNFEKIVLPNTSDTVTVVKWHTSKYFSYIIYSLKTSSLVIGVSIDNNKNTYSRIE